MAVSAFYADAERCDFGCACKASLLTTAMNNWYNEEGIGTGKPDACTVLSGEEGQVFGLEASVKFD